MAQTTARRRRPGRPPGPRGLQVVEQPNEGGETKHDKFVRLAEPRVGKILADLNNLRKLANREYYEPAEEEITELLTTLRSQMDFIEESFKTGREITGFRFRRGK